jgi:hypothetical protein
MQQAGKNQKNSYLFFKHGFSAAALWFFQGSKKKPLRFDPKRLLDSSIKLALGQL